MLLMMWHKLLSFIPRRRRFVDIDNQELDAMYEDDTIDIKNFGRMDPGPAKDDMRKMLVNRMNWYMSQRLYDWAEQIDIALWIDERSGNNIEYVSEIKKAKSRNIKGQRVMMVSCKHMLNSKVVDYWCHMTAYNLFRGTRAKDARRYLANRLIEHRRSHD